MQNGPGENPRQEAERGGKEAVEEVSPWVARLARFGYVTKGVMYVVVGLLAVETATGTGGRTTSLRGALQTIGAQPLGRVMLGLTALGLAGYALWRLIHAVGSPEGEGKAKRIGHGAAGLIYAGLALAAGRLVLAPGSGGGSPKGWTALVLSMPLGWVVVAGVGVIVASYSLHQLSEAYEAEFRAHLNLDEMSDRAEKWIMQGGRFGVASRAVVFGIVGVLLMVAGLQFEPSEAGTLDGALQALFRRPFGSWMLGVVALGLIAYGLLMLAMARYGRIAPSRALYHQ